MLEEAQGGEHNGQGKWLEDTACKHSRELFSSLNATTLQVSGRLGGVEDEIDSL